jgi:hypothetical protein
LFFYEQVWAHIELLKPKRPSNRAMTEIMHQNATVEMTLLQHRIIIGAGRTVDKEVIDDKETESWERVKIPSEPHMQYMGTDTEGLMKMMDKLQMGIESSVNYTNVGWLANSCRIKERS